MRATAHPPKPRTKLPPKLPPPWTGETFNGLPIVRGRLIPPQARSEAWVIVVVCPHCGEKHIHGWPDGPEAMGLSHRAADCFGCAANGYYVAPLAAAGVHP